MKAPRFTRGVLSLVGAALLGIATFDPAYADNSVTTSLLGGTRTASVANLNLGEVNYSHSDQAVTGSMTLTADDSTALNLGWNVSILSSQFVWNAGSTGAEGGIAIPAANFSLTSTASPIRTAGQAISGLLGPKVPTTPSPLGTLNTARVVLVTGPLSGAGTYTQALGVSLTVPGQSAAGTYTATLTTTISPGLPL